MQLLWPFCLVGVQTSLEHLVLAHPVGLTASLKVAGNSLARLDRLDRRRRRWWSWSGRGRCCCLHLGRIARIVLVPGFGRRRARRRAWRDTEETSPGTSVELAAAWEASDAWTAAEAEGSLAAWASSSSPPLLPLAPSLGRRHRHHSRFPSLACRLHHHLQAHAPSPATPAATPLGSHHLWSRRPESRHRHGSPCCAVAALCHCVKSRQSESTP